MTQFSFAIDPATNDLFLDSSNNIATVTDAQAVAQHARCRLMTFEGEWFLDKDAGVPWLSDIMAKRFDSALGEAIVKAELLDTYGVTGVSTFSVGFDGRKRALIIKEIEVETVYDQEVSL